MNAHTEIVEFKIGDKVRTLKGCRLNGTSSGVIVGWSKWKDYEAAQVKKTDGKIRQFLIKNLVKMD